MGKEKAETVPKGKSLCGRERDGKNTGVPRWGRGVEGVPQ